MEPKQSDCVRLSSVTELIRTQLNGLRSIGFGKPIHTKQALQKQVFLVLFYSIFNNRNPRNKLSTVVIVKGKKPENPEKKQGREPTTN